MTPDFGFLAPTPTAVRLLSFTATLTAPGRVEVGSTPGGSSTFFAHPPWSK
jgi:hypothetical protein